MKRIGTLLIACILSLYTFCLPVSAKVNTHLDTSLLSSSLYSNTKTSIYLDPTELSTSQIQVFEEENIKISATAYKVRNEILVDTALKNAEVVVTNEGVYVNGTRKSGVEITIGGVLVGFLVDGVIMYATGYSGGALAAATIKMLVAFVAAHPVGFIVAVLLVALVASSVKQYSTSSGNSCVLKASGNGYNCMYSVL